jgi:hypothetical protein
MQIYEHQHYRGPGREQNRKGLPPPPPSEPQEYKFTDLPLH